MSTEETRARIEDEIPEVQLSENDLEEVAGGTATMTVYGPLVTVTVQLTTPIVLPQNIVAE